MQNAAVDIVAFPHEDDDWAWTEIQKSAREDRIDVYTPGKRRPLSEQEKQVAYDCISSMLDADSLEGSMQGVLHNLGLYYKADRVYLLRAGEGRRIITMPYEWTNVKKRSIQQAVTGMAFERFPLAGALHEGTGAGLPDAGIRKICCAGTHRRRCVALYGGADDTGGPAGQLFVHRKPA